MTSRRRQTWKPSDIRPASAAAEAVPPFPPPEPEPAPATAKAAPGKRLGSRTANPPQPRTGRGPRRDEDAVIDLHVGQRMRLRRTLLGMSQERLGEAVGLTFQQIQKYERGANRMSAGLLHRVARVLDVPISFFFDGLEEGQSAPPVETGSLLSRLTLELARHFHGIADETVRGRVYALVKSLSSATGSE